MHVIGGLVELAAAGQAAGGLKESIDPILENLEAGIRKLERQGKGQGGRAKCAR